MHGLPASRCDVSQGQNPKQPLSCWDLGQQHHSPMGPASHSAKALPLPSFQTLPDGSVRQAGWAGQFTDVKTEAQTGHVSSSRSHC